MVADYMVRWNEWVERRLPPCDQADCSTVVELGLIVDALKSGIDERCFGSGGGEVSLEAFAITETAMVCRGSERYRADQWGANHAKRREQEQKREIQRGIERRLEEKEGQRRAADLAMESRETRYRERCREARMPKNFIRVNGLLLWHGWWTNPSAIRETAVMLGVLKEDSFDYFTEEVRDQIFKRLMFAYMGDGPWLQLCHEQEREIIKECRANIVARLPFHVKALMP